MCKKYVCGLFFSLILSLFFSIYVFAETVVLKSGKSVEGKILEKTDTYIKIDLLGTTLTYFLEDVEKIEEAKVEPKEENKAEPGEEGKLLPLAVGNTWYYDSYGTAPMGRESAPGPSASTNNSQSYSVKIVGKDTMDGKEVFIQEKRDEEDNLLERVYLSYDGNSLLCHKIEATGQGRKARVFTPPRVEAKLDAKPGEELLDQKSSVLFAGKTAIKTALGKFDVYEFITQAFRKIRRDTHKYYALGVGIVKEITVRKGEGQNYVTKSELVKYTLADNSDSQKN